MKLKVRFSKKNNAKYLSHLDLVRLFHRASRRAGLPVEITQGYSPRQKISIMPALKLGVESEDLEANFVLNKDMNREGFRQILQNQLPEGITILEVSPAPVYKNANVNRGGVIMKGRAG